MGSPSLLKVVQQQMHQREIFLKANSALDVGDRNEMHQPPHLCIPIDRVSNRLLAYPISMSGKCGACPCIYAPSIHGRLRIVIQSRGQGGAQ